MRSFARFTFKAATMLSAILFIVTTALWVRSQSKEDCWIYETAIGSSLWNVDLVTANGLGFASARRLEMHDVPGELPWKNWRARQRGFLHLEYTFPMTGGPVG